MLPEAQEIWDALVADDTGDPVQAVRQATVFYGAARLVSPLQELVERGWIDAKFVTNRWGQVHDGRFVGLTDEGRAEIERIRGGE